MQKRYMLPEHRRLVTILHLVPAVDDRREVAAPGQIQGIRSHIRLATK